MSIRTILLLLLLCSGCANLNRSIVLTEQGNISVYFCPRDNCNSKLVNLIKNSSSSVYCALYDIDLKDVIYALANKSHSIDVKIIIDNDNFNNQIKGEGVRIDNSNQLMHNKFCIFDNKKIFTGSFNPTERGAYKNNNNMLVIYSKYLAENYKKEFDELWQGNFGKGDKVKNPIIYLNNIKIENYFCPEDDCAWHITDVLNSANKSIYFMTFSFTSEKIANSIINKYGKGLDVKGVFEKSQRSKYSQFDRMKDFGLDVKWDNNSYNMHHKVFIIDNKTVITGSFNPTKSANKRNDENILIIHNKEIADKYLREFNLIYDND